MRHAYLFFGCSIALAAASLVVTRDYEREGSLYYPYTGGKIAPNDVGPVVDTTPESKRSRRRRLAKEGRKEAV